MDAPVQTEVLASLVNDGRSGSGFDFTKSRNPMLIIQAIRLAFLLAILLITLVFQGLQPEFVNLEVLMPTYLMMSAMFLLNSIYLLFLERLLRRWIATALLFFIESAFITGLIFFTGINQSIFLFLYLVNIILCGFVFGRKGALILALWTSTLFSVILVFGPEIKGQTLFFAIGLNNIAFFAVSFLSGILSEQLNFMGNELKARGKDLRALRNLNELILENIATGLISINKKGEILLANPAASEILEIPGSKLLSVGIESVLKGIMDRIRGLGLAGGNRKSERFDWSYLNHGQEKMILEVTVSSLIDEDDLLTGYVLAFQDSTKVRRLEFQMRQSEKLAAVGQLAAGIAHEIRNPLASISGSIQLLETSFTSRQEEERKLMAIVLKEIDRLNGLITEFLEYVRPETPGEDPVDVNSLLLEILDMAKLNKSLREDTEVITDLRSRMRISGHKNKLKQALLNIIINAYQAMQKAERPLLELKTYDRDNRVLILIRDHGVGIEEGRLRKVFEPFHTTKPKGTGLGLAVTHKIIENHNGRVYVESTVGQGTEFTLEFQARPENLGLAESTGTTDDLKWSKRGNG